MQSLLLLFGVELVVSANVKSKIFYSNNLIFNHTIYGGNDFCFRHKFLVLSVIDINFL